MHKAVVFVPIAFAIVLAGAQLQGALSGIIGALFPAKTVAQVSASLERYDFMAGRIEPVKSLASIGRDITHVQKIADELAKEIVSDKKGASVLVLFGNGKAVVAYDTQPMARNMTCEPEKP